MPQPSKKRRRVEDVAGPSSRKKAKVVAGSEGGQPSQSLSRNAQVWFKQDLFGGVDIEDVEDDDDEVEDEDGEEEEDSDEAPSDSSSVRGFNQSNRLCVLTV